MLTCRLVSRTADFLDLREGWDRLSRAGNESAVYSFWGWVRAWWEASQSLFGLRILVVEQGPDVRLILPLCERRDRPGEWTFICEEGADYCDVLSQGGDREALDALSDWLRANADWESIHIRGVPKGSGLIDVLGEKFRVDSSLKNRFLSLVTQTFPSGYVRWNPSHPFIDATALAAKKDILKGKHYRKHANWFTRTAELRYRCLRRVEEIEGSLPPFIRLHVTRWRSQNQVSLLVKDRQRNFILKMVKELGRYQVLRMDLLEWGNRLIAAHLGFQLAGRLHFYLPCYDPELAKHSPGRLLLGHIIANSARDGVTTFDFLRGRESYKDRYASGITSTAEIHYFPLPRGHGADLGQELQAEESGLSLEQARVFDECAPSYHSRELHPMERNLLTFFRDRWHRLAVLDLGVGTGRTAYTFGPLAKRYVGLDYSERMISLARESLGETETMRFRVGDARELSGLFREPFNLVLFTFNGIDYVDYDERLKILAEVRRVLTPDGHFFFTSHNLGVFPYPLELFFRDRNPVRWVRRIVEKLLFHARIARANRSVNFEQARQKGWALVQDGAHDFRLLTYYGMPSFQKRQLERAGFELVATYDVNGKPVVLDDRIPGYMIGYLCKPSAV